MFSLLKKWMSIHITMHLSTLARILEIRYCLGLRGSSLFIKLFTIPCSFTEHRKKTLFFFCVHNLLCAQAFVTSVYFFIVFYDVFFLSRFFVDVKLFNRLAMTLFTTLVISIWCDNSKIANTRSCWGFFFSWLYTQLILQLSMHDNHLRWNADG